eukprot:Nk52_evm1s2462 gene=Nk52_evmTU1s2462
MRNHNLSLIALVFGVATISFTCTLLFFPQPALATLPPRTLAKWNAFVEEQKRFYNSASGEHTTSNENTGSFDQMQPGAQSRYYKSIVLPVPSSERPKIDYSAEECVTVDILFHGFSASPQQYLEWADVLSNTYHHDVLLPLWTGFGWVGDQSQLEKNDILVDGVKGLPESSKEVFKYVDKVMAVIDHKDVEEGRICRVNIAGLSGGGALALYAPFSDSLYTEWKWIWSKARWGRTRKVKVNNLLAMSPWLNAEGTHRELQLAYKIPAWLVSIFAGTDVYDWAFEPVKRNENGKCASQRLGGTARSCTYYVIHVAAVNQFGHEILAKYKNGEYNDLPDMKVQIVIGEADDTVSEDAIRDLASALRSHSDDDVQFCALPRFVGHSFFAPRDMSGTVEVAPNRWKEKVELAQQWMGEANLALVRTLALGLQKSLQGPACSIRGEMFGGRTCIHCAANNVMSNYMFYGTDYCPGKSDFIYPADFRDRGFVPLENDKQCCGKDNDSDDDKYHACDIYKDNIDFLNFQARTCRSNDQSNVQAMEVNDNMVVMEPNTSGEHSGVPNPPKMVTIVTNVPEFIHNGRGAYMSAAVCIQPMYGQNTNYQEREWSLLRPLDEYDGYKPLVRDLIGYSKLFVMTELSVPSTATQIHINVKKSSSSDKGWTWAEDNNHFYYKLRTAKVSKEYQKNNNKNEFLINTPNFFGTSEKEVFIFLPSLLSSFNGIKAINDVEAYTSKGRLMDSIAEKYKTRTQSQVLMIRLSLLVPEDGILTDIVHKINEESKYPTNVQIQLYGPSVPLGMGNAAYGPFLEPYAMERLGVTVLEASFLIDVKHDLNANDELEFRFYHPNDGVEPTEKEVFRKVGLGEYLDKATKDLNDDSPPTVVLGPFKWGLFDEVPADKSQTIKCSHFINGEDDLKAWMIQKFPQSGSNQMACNEPAKKKEPKNLEPVPQPETARAARDNQQSDAIPKQLDVKWKTDEEMKLELKSMDVVEQHPFMIHPSAFNSINYRHPMDRRGGSSTPKNPRFRDMIKVVFRFVVELGVRAAGTDDDSAFRSIFVTGSIPQLGNWMVAYSLPLLYQGKGVYQGHIWMNKNSKEIVQYKLIYSRYICRAEVNSNLKVLHDDREFIFEYGKSYAVNNIPMVADPSTDAVKYLKPGQQPTANDASEIAAKEDEEYKTFEVQLTSLVPQITKDQSEEPWGTLDQKEETAIVDAVLSKFRGGSYVKLDRNWHWDTMKSDFDDFTFRADLKEVEPATTERQRRRGGKASASQITNYLNGTWVFDIRIPATKYNNFKVFPKNRVLSMEEVVQEDSDIKSLVIEGNFGVPLEQEHPELIRDGTEHTHSAQTDTNLGFVGYAQLFRDRRDLVLRRLQAEIGTLLKDEANRQRDLGLLKGCKNS